MLQFYVKIYYTSIDSSYMLLIAYHCMNLSKFLHPTLEKLLLPYSVHLSHILTLISVRFTNSVLKTC